MTCAFLVLIQNHDFLQNESNRQISTQYSERGVNAFVLFGCVLNEKLT